MGETVRLNTDGPEIPDRVMPTGRSELIARLASVLAGPARLPVERLMLGALRLMLVVPGVSDRLIVGPPLGVLPRLMLGPALGVVERLILGPPPGVVERLMLGPPPGVLPRLKLGLGWPPKGWTDRAVGVAPCGLGIALDGVRVTVEGVRLMLLLFGCRKGEEESSDRQSERELSEGGRLNDGVREFEP